MKFKMIYYTPPIFVYLSILLIGFLPTKVGEELPYSTVVIVAENKDKTKQTVSLCGI